MAQDIQNRDASEFVSPLQTFLKTYDELKRNNPEIENDAEHVRESLRSAGLLKHPKSWGDNWGLATTFLKSFEEVGYVVHQKKSRAWASTAMFCNWLLFIALGLFIKSGSAYEVNFVSGKRSITPTQHSHPLEQSRMEYILNADGVTLWVSAWLLFFIVLFFSVRLAANLGYRQSFKQQARPSDEDTPEPVWRTVANTESALMYFASWLLVAGYFLIDIYYSSIVYAPAIIVFGIRHWLIENGKLEKRAQYVTRIPTE